MKCANGFSSAGFGNDADNFAIAISRAPSNSGDNVDDVSFNPLVAAFAAVLLAVSLLLLVLASFISAAPNDDILRTQLLDCVEEVVNACVVELALNAKATDNIAVENFISYT